MRLVVIESPYSGDTEANIAYARRAVRDCLLRGEAPIASHLVYTQPGIFNDSIPLERQFGILAHHAWMRKADVCALYIDRGVSKGMEQGLAAAKIAGIQVEYRKLD
jgi:hypothetical protein